MVLTKAQDLVKTLLTMETALNGAARYIHTSATLLQKKIKAAEEMGVAGITPDLDELVNATYKEAETILGNLAKIVSEPVTVKAVPLKRPRKIVRLGVGTTTPILVEVKEKIAEEKSIEVSASPPQKGETKEKKKEFGVRAVSARLFRKAFSGSPSEYPQTMEALLERAYGPNWGEQRLTEFTGFQKTEQRSFAEDLALGGQSVLRKRMASAAQRLLAVKEGRTPKNKSIHPMLSNLYNEVDVPRRWPRIVSALKHCGVQLA